MKGGQVLPRKTDEDFKNEVHNLVGNEYTFLDKYVNAKTKLKVKHNTCGNTYEVAPDKFLIGRRCPYCAGNIKKTTQQFKQEVQDLVDDEYIVLGDYKGANKKVLIKHSACNNTYKVTPHDFLRGSRCPYCSGLMKKTTEQFKQEVYDLVEDGYTVLGNYINANTKILMKHNKCNHEYEVTPSAFVNSGTRCPYCYGKFKKTTKQFKQEVYDLVGDEYTVLGEYINAKTKIEVLHNKCDNTYMVIPDNFLKGSRCPYCYQSGSSHGNEYIAKYLDEHGIKYSREYRFEDCVYKRKLPFDFYLPKLNVAIEYDGEQHYSPNYFFEEHDPFKERQIKDKIKSKYCFEHSIKLIRIKYTQFNQIEDILDKELNAK